MGDEDEKQLKKKLARTLQFVDKSVLP